MKKLLLLLFLFSLSSNALAKVEMWHCRVSDGMEFKDEYYKIDTTEPIVYERFEGKWIVYLTTSVFRYEYSKKDDSLFIKHSKSNETVRVYDFLLKQMVSINKSSGKRSQSDCAIKY